VELPSSAFTDRFARILRIERGTIAPTLVEDFLSAASGAVQFCMPARTREQLFAALQAASDGVWFTAQRARKAKAVFIGFLEQFLVTFSRHNPSTI
jgi:hypothetical protein